jgi:tetratricopeptide (TPR) repeat protein
MSRPVVLISAVSRELQSTRYIVANSLTALGYEPMWQDIAPTETCDQKFAIRRMVDRSRAVVQIVGQHHGFSPTEPDEEFGSVSYTQYEALYAHKTGKPVRYILLDGDYLTDCEKHESAELRKLQSDYRTQVETHHSFYQPSSTPQSTADIVLALRADLSKLSRPSLKRTAVLAALFLIIISGITWIFLRQDETSEPVASTNKVRDDTGDENDLAPFSPLSKMERILLNLANAENRSRIPGGSLTLGDLRTRAYILLETEFDLIPGTLATNLPSLALKLYANPDTDPIVRASAAYALSKFEEAEQLFLEEESKAEAAVSQTGKGAADLRTQRILSLEGAAQFATAQIQFTRAVEHYRAAAALTSVEQDPLEWARIHHMFAYALTHNGKYSEVADILPQVIAVYGKHLGAEHPNTLGSANNLANALNSQGKHAEAEQRHRSILEIRQRVLGAEHPDTLISRSNFASTLNYQGKHSQAAEQHRAVLIIRERVLGADHPDTLFSRNNLAIALEAQGKHAEAEEQYRAVLSILESGLGAEHPDTLTSRDNLAKSLRFQRKYAEAEVQSRSVLAIRERLLGAEHYDVFLSCHKLALSLANQKKNVEALVFAQRGLAGFTKSLGADNPTSNAARKLVTLLESRQAPSGGGGE